MDNRFDVFPSFAELAVLFLLFWTAIAVGGWIVFELLDLVLEITFTNPLN